MAKGLSKERVIETALALIDKGGSKINFRDIARELNCAHTNLYNYFDSFDALLWDAQESIMRQLQNEISGSAAEAAEPDDKLAAFFRGFVDFYLAHKGWFALAWFEPLNSPRPKSHYDLTISLVDDMVAELTTVFERLGQATDTQRMRMNLHNVNAYIHGELSIYLAGRGLIREDAAFREYVTSQAVRMMRLFVME